MELRQTLQLKQQLRLTQQLQQAIKLLQLNRLELAAIVQQELSENPLLEELPGTGAEEVPMTSLQGEEPAAQEPKDEDDWKKIIEEHRDRAPLGGRVKKTTDLPPFEATLTKKEDLYDYLIWQLQMSRLSREQQMIGMELIGNINHNGYILSESVYSIAEQLDVPMDDVEQVRRLVIRFDPVGVGAVTLEECLLEQARVFYPDDELLRAMIVDHLPDLVGRSILTLHRRLGVTEREVEETRAIITSLDPKPGRNFSGEPTQYVTPDLYVRKDDDEYIVVLNEDGLPKLRISSYYRNLIGGKIKEETKEYLKRKVRSAVWFLRSIHQRQSTVKLVGESIVKFQREFLDHGIGHLRPLVLRDVAEDIEMHESTVSRVTSNKFMHTPQGLFGMKFFFNPRIQSRGGEDLASEAVREKIRDLVSSEDPRKPMSDQQIVETLATQGLKIARRTVAKYRGQLGIMSSSKRVRLS